jgi:hypothetical protein
MTQLKKIGDYSIDSIYITVQSPNAWMLVILIMGILFFVISILISNFLCGVVGIALFAIFCFGSCIITESVPALRIGLFDDNGKDKNEYSCSDFYDVVIIKDVDQMVKQVQEKVDFLTTIVERKIKETEEKNHIESCILNMESKIKTMIK